MAFQFVNYAGLEPQGNPALRNLVDNLVKGFSAARLPIRTGQEEKQRELANQLSQYKVQYEPERQKLERSLTNARIQKALRPAQPSLSNFEKAMAGAERIKQQYGADSAEYALANQYVKRLSEGSGTSLSVDPATGAVTFSQGGGSSRGGGQMVQLPDGTVVQRPTTPTTTAQQKGSTANVVREEMAKYVTNPYIGTGSNAKLLEDRLLYSQTNDPVKKKEIGDRLVSAAVSMKLAPEYASMQLNAQGVPSSVQSLKHQQEAITQGWAEALPKVVNNLPPELQAQAKEQHDAAIEAINQARADFIVKGLPLKGKGNVGKIVATKNYGGKTYVKNEKGEWFEK